MCPHIATNIIQSIVIGSLYPSGGYSPLTGATEGWGPALVAQVEAFLAHLDSAQFLPVGGLLLGGAG